MELAFFIILSIAAMLGILLLVLMIMKGKSERYEKIYVAILAAFSVTFISFLYITGLYKMLWLAFVKGLLFNVLLLIFFAPLFIEDLIDGEAESSFQDNK